MMLVFLENIMDLRHTHRIHIPADLAPGLTVAANPDQTHYLLNVLRLKSGDTLRLFNGRNGEFRGTLANPSKKSVDIILHDQTRGQEPEPDLWLCCAPIKKAHFDTMIEKATELGVSEIQPILTHRTQIREVNIDRAYSICREAAEQSERLSVPAIGNPVSLDDMIDVFPQDRALIVCAELGEAISIQAALTSPALQEFAKAAIVTGPEGGFSYEEFTELHKARNAHFVRLGPRILRADTAAIAALTCWQAIHGDWKTTA